MAIALFMQRCDAVYRLPTSYDSSFFYNSRPELSINWPIANEK
jgi:hypothetical protein